VRGEVGGKGRESIVGFYRGKKKAMCASIEGFFGKGGQRQEKAVKDSLSARRGGDRQLGGGPVGKSGKGRKHLWGGDSVGGPKKKGAKASHKALGEKGARKKSWQPPMNRKVTKGGRKRRKDQGNQVEGRGPKSGKREDPANQTVSYESHVSVSAKRRVKRTNLLI